MKFPVGLNAGLVLYDAVKQCGRVKVPEIVVPETVKSYCQDNDETSLKILWEGKKTGLSDIDRNENQPKFSFLLAPEGVFL